MRGGIELPQGLPETDFRHGRFEPGRRLGSRYRIVAMLGRGGMGEVYRADDLELGQSVALKFLPEQVTADELWRGRFRNEVRTARQVAHANVCRIYDIGQEDGHIFLSMEYIDGEDLGGVLRRMGRPSPEKALEIARQICLGLAAAHERSVLHRDLKPANIMIDGRGRVRITDFGLAGFIDQLQRENTRAGTPAYMAPEQLAHGQVSVRSDIYSLGLILHEVFTGKRVFDTNDVHELERLHSGESPSTPSSISGEIDPVVERAIMRCLETDPDDRPQSVYEVLAALPGGDPLARALAEGETPSPQMVAAAGVPGGLNPAIALSLLAALVGFGLLAMWLIDRENLLFKWDSMGKPAAVLRDRALTMIGDFGWSTSPADVAAWYEVDSTPVAFVVRNVDRPDPWKPLEDVNLPLLRFDMRTGTEPMVRLSWTGRIAWTRPPFDQPGMTRLTLDSRGNLLRFEAIPGQIRDEALEPGTTGRAQYPEPNVAAVFAAAGLDESGFEPVKPDFVPSVYCDHLLAWRGNWPGELPLPLNVHAGWQDGRLTYLQLVAPWKELQSEHGPPVAITLATVVMAAIGLLFMIRNLRLGRGDRKGAFRLALFVFAIAMIRWLCTADHSTSTREFDVLFRAFGISCGLAVLTWAMYLAAEPFVRRLWPQSLISWARLLSGRWRDPRVGRDLLIGAATGAATLCVPYAPLGMPSDFPDAFPVFPGNVDVLLGGRYLPGQLCDVIIDALPVACGFLLTLLVFRLLLRRTFLAAAAFILLFMALQSLSWGADELDVTEISFTAVVSFMLAGSFAFIVIRFGLLAVIAMIVAWSAIEIFSPTFDFNQWFAGQLLAGPLFVLAMGLYAFWISTAGRPLFGDSLKT